VTPFTYTVDGCVTDLKQPFSGKFSADSLWTPDVKLLDKIQNHQLIL